jgi:hypothetical protein
MSELHPDDVAVDAFAAAMKAKMARARALGRSGWLHIDPIELWEMLEEHVEKGDPVDVANFCMMLWHNQKGSAGRVTTDPIEAATHVMRAHRAFRPGLSSKAVRMAVLDALDAAESSEALARQCDEPGCQREASCGFSTETGYRRACHEHSDWAKNRQPGALPGSAAET